MWINLNLFHIFGPIWAAIWWSTVMLYAPLYDLSTKFNLFKKDFMLLTIGTKKFKVLTIHGSFELSVKWKMRPEIVLTFLCSGFSKHTNQFIFFFGGLDLWKVQVNRWQLLIYFKSLEGASFVVLLSVVAIATTIASVSLTIKFGFSFGSTNSYLWSESTESALELVTRQSV